jgi:hypothetical protein
VAMADPDQELWPAKLPRWLAASLVWLRLQSRKIVDASKNYVKCLFEALLILSVSILPILFITIIRLNSKKLAPSGKNFIDEFSSYFERGELGFLSLGLCGSIFWMIFAELKSENKAAPIVIGIATIVITIFSSMVVTGGTDLSTQNSTLLFHLTIYAYAASLLAYVIIKVRTLETPNIDFTRAADKGYERLIPGADDHE